MNIMKKALDVLKSLAAMKRLDFLICMVLSCIACGAAGNKAEFNLATYNIRYYSKSDSVNGNVWSVRCPVIADMVKFHDFDIFGTQEGLKHQLEMLKSCLPGYDYIGGGRNDGKESGEHAAIFYDTAKFDLVDHGDFWLSETPDRPGRGWDAALPRICTWGKFRHKGSGKMFLFFNLHMDHIGKEARIESGKLIEKKIKEWQEELPTFLSGDFNVDQNNECYSSICNSGFFNDSHEVSDFVYATNGTFNDWKPAGFSPSRIDHIFVSKDIHVSKYGILTDTYRTTDNPEYQNKAVDSFDVEVLDYETRLPSDHFPIRITVSF